MRETVSYEVPQQLISDGTIALHTMENAYTSNEVETIIINSNYNDTRGFLYNSMD